MIDFRKHLKRMDSTALVKTDTPTLSIVPQIQFEDLQVALSGDLSRLPAEGRVRFYTQLCEFTGLNPLAKPFDWITFQGKLTLYPNKGCAEQLRSLNKVSFEGDAERKLEFGCLITTVRVTDKNGRTDFATAALPFDDKMGAADKALAIMKCETKAKRRATFSICGLTMFAREDGEDLDEVELVSKRKLKQVSTTESSTDRAALLNDVVSEPKSFETLNNAQQEAVMEAAAKTIEAEIVTPATPPVAPPVTPSTPPPAATKPATTPPATGGFTNPDGTLSAATVDAIKITLMENDPKASTEYLIAKGKIKKGDPIEKLDPTAANFIIKSPRRFAQMVADWVKGGSK